MARLETDRLLLSPLRRGDEPRLRPVLSDPLTMWAWGEPLGYGDIARWIGWSLEAEKQWGLGRQLVRLKATGEPVGDCGFFWWEHAGEDRIDAGWIVARRHWRQGYATEAMQALLPALFALGHCTAWAKVPQHNRASRRTAEALGFRPAGAFHEAAARWERMAVYRLNAPA